MQCSAYMNAAVCEHSFARFLGYDMHSGNPMGGADWFNQVQALRDEAVDNFIDQHKPKAIAFMSHSFGVRASHARDLICCASRARSLYSR